MNRGDAGYDPSAVPCRTLTVSEFGRDATTPFRTFIVERCRFTTVAALRRHHADRLNATEIPGGIRFTNVIDRSEFGTIVEEYTLS